MKRRKGRRPTGCTDALVIIGLGVMLMFKLYTRIGAVMKSTISFAKCVGGAPGGGRRWRFAALW